MILCLKWISFIIILRIQLVFQFNYKNAMENKFGYVEILEEYDLPYNLK